MAKYYIVPVTSRNIKIYNLTLFELLENVDTELANRENTRIELTYERKDCYSLQKSGFINLFNENTSNLYRERGVPEKLILKDNNGKITEFFTDIEVKCDNKSNLDMCRVKAEVVQKFLSSNFDYHNKVEKFLRKSKKKAKRILKRKDSVKHGK